MSRQRHSVSMTNHKKHMLDLYNSCIDTFSSKQFNLVPLHDVEDYCSRLLEEQHKNGALVKQHEWTDNVDMICSILSHTPFIGDAFGHVSSVT